MPSSILFVIASLIWGSTYWAITLELGEVPPLISVVYRFGLASLTLFLWCLARGDRLLLPLRAQRWIVVQGFLSFALTYACVYTSEQHLISGLVAVVFATMVFWTPICARVLFGAPIPARTWTAGSAAMLGVFLMFYDTARTALGDILAGGSDKVVICMVLAVFGSITTSAGSVLVSKVREHSTNLMLTMAWSMLWGAIMVAAWALLSGQHFVVPRTPSYWGGLVYLSIFGSVIAFSCYFTLIHRLGSQKAAFIGIVEPVISVLLSIQLEHYRPGMLEWAGIVSCLGGVTWALWMPRGERADSKIEAGTAANAMRRHLPSGLAE